MKAEDLNDIYRALGRLIEYIKAYKEMDIDYKVYYLTRIENQCRAIIFHDSFRSSVFSEYMERLGREPYYINRIAGRIKEILDLGLVNIVHNSLEELNQTSINQSAGENTRAEIKMWCDMKRIDGSPIIDNMVTEAKEILDIYNFVFPNSRADNTESNKKDAEELTEREIKYYGKAIEAEMAKKTEQGYKWFGSNVSLGYFINKVHRPTATERLPYKRMEELWGVKRLDSAVHQSADRKHKWEKDIDALFEE